VIQSRVVVQKDPEREPAFNFEAFIRHAPVLLAARRHAILSNMLAYLDDHQSESIPLSWLAKYVGVEPSSLSRLCSRELGITCKTLINTYKVYCAVLIIAQEDIDIASLNARVGFREGASLCRAFKSVTGLTPSIFKQIAQSALWRIALAPRSPETSHSHGRSRIGAG